MPNNCCRNKLKSLQRTEVGAVGIAAGVYPLQKLVPTDFLRYNFMAYIAVGSLLLLTFTGWDRFIPLFKLPQEPVVRLKKHAKQDI